MLFTSVKLINSHTVNGQGSQGRTRGPSTNMIPCFYINFYQNPWRAWIPRPATWGPYTMNSSTSIKLRLRPSGSGPCMPCRNHRD